MNQSFHNTIGAHRVEDCEFCQRANQKQSITYVNILNQNIKVNDD